MNHEDTLTEEIHAYVVKAQWDTDPRAVLSCVLRAEEHLLLHCTKARSVWWVPWSLCILAVNVYVQITSAELLHCFSTPSKVSYPGLGEASGLHQAQHAAIWAQPMDTQSRYDPQSLCCSYRACSQLGQTPCAGQRNKVYDVYRGFPMSYKTIPMGFLLLCSARDSGRDAALEQYRRNVVDLILMLPSPGMCLSLTLFFVLS